MPTKSEIDAFIAAAKYGSISAAAEELYVTQPALSRRIASLEDELGCRLLERGKGQRAVTLTPQGSAFLPLARTWGEVWRDAMRIADMVERPVAHLAAIGSASSFLLPAVMPRAVQEGSGWRLDFHLCHSWEGYSLVEQGRADVAVIDSVESPARRASAPVQAHPLYAVPFAVVGGSAWSGTCEVDAADLDPSREVRMPWTTEFDVWHDRLYGVSATPRVTLDSSALARHALHGGLFAFMPKTEALRLAGEDPGLVVMDLQGGPSEEVINCLVGADAPARPEVAELLDAIRDAVRSCPDVRCLF